MWRRERKNLLPLTDRQTERERERDMTSLLNPLITPQRGVMEKRETGGLFYLNVQWMQDIDKVLSIGTDMSMYAWLRYGAFHRY